jgi:hypothetical protein
LGYLKAWRNREDRPFADGDLGLLAEVAPALGSALRRRAIGPDLLEQADAAPERPAGVLILDTDLRCQSATPSAQAWLAALPGATIARNRGYLPQTVYAVAARASAASCPPGSAPGRWMVAG